MAIGTLKQRRIDSANGGEPTRNPCMRCLQKMAREGLSGHNSACHMLVEESLRIGFSEEGIKYSKCSYCLNSNENCWEIPLKFASYLTEVNRDMDACLVAASGDKAKASDKLRDTCSILVQSIQADGYFPQAEHMYAHSGSTTTVKETGVLFAKRARSKADIAKKEAKKRKMEEADSDSDTAVPTPKKKRYGIKGVRVTEAEQLRRDKELKVEQYHRRAEAIKKKATRDRNKSEKSFLTSYTRKYPQGRNTGVEGVEDGEDEDI